MTRVVSARDSLVALCSANVHLGPTTAVMKRGRMATTRLNRRQRRELDVSHLIDGRFATEATRLLHEHDVRVCHWRGNMSGIAWIGHPRRPIEAPHPRSALSFAVLAHEVGHHVLGSVRPRWREEQLAWQFAFTQMDALDVPLTAAVRERYAASMRYALAKALRRGLREIPDELAEFVSSNRLPSV